MKTMTKTAAYKLGEALALKEAGLRFSGLGRDLGRYAKKAVPAVEGALKAESSVATKVDPVSIVRKLLAERAGAAQLAPAVK